MEESYVVEVGPVAHGGHCVARIDGQVVFVRHALPGEKVRVRITERSKRFLRGDAVEILEPIEGRVTPPCVHAGHCGGCDFQHASPQTQRDLLTDVVREQVRRLAGVEWDGQVEAVAPDDLGWRTRVQWAVDDDGRAGLRRHRSHDVVPIESCPIAHPDLPRVADQSWDDDAVESIVSSTGDRLLATDATITDELEREVDGVIARDGVVRAGRGDVVEQVGGRRFRVTGSGFWQVHPAAASTLVDTVLAGARVRPGDRIADLYAGVGLFTAFLSEAAGPSGEVIWVESDRGAASDARHNLTDLANVRLVRDRTDRALRRGDVGERADVVVLDPPRAGAKDAIDAIADLQPRTIVYVACDPAALGRDLKSLFEHDYELMSLRAFALFPMTHHVEAVAVLDRR